MLEGKGRFWKSGNKVYIYVPFDVALDSAFPLKGKKGNVKVIISGRNLVISEL